MFASSGGFDEAFAETFGETFVRALLGNFDPDQKYMLKLEYCPSKRHSDYLVAKTLLFPGMRNTPEPNLIWDSDMTSAEKRRVAEAAESYTIPHIFETKDVSLSHFFLENGTP